ncbi:MAG: diguanylate cyclase [Spirochaetaceae bacterium]|nr:diguanylate cyclase [Spirochaetaceae bacterium]
MARSIRIVRDRGHLRGRDIFDLIEHLPVCVYRTTPEGRILEANQAFARMLGYGDAKELMSVNARSLYFREQERDAFFAKMANGAYPYDEFRLRAKDGRVVWVRDFARFVRSGDGKVEFVDGALIDITELKTAESELMRSELEYRRLFEKAHDAIIVFAIEDEAILDVNDSACRLYGFDRKEFLAMSLAVISKDVGHGKERIAMLLDGSGDRTFETTHYRKDQTEMRLEINAAVVSFRGRQAIISINRDVTDRAKRLEDLRRLALTDPLTGIANRLLFDDHLALALAQASHSGAPLAVMFLDLDGFKEVNDEHGHGVGDEVLRATALRLRVAVRRADTVARMGGDEFAIILPELSSALYADDVARKVLEAIREPLDVGGCSLRVSASLGIAVHPRDGSDAETLLAAADSAMYEVKRSGKDGFRSARPADSTLSAQSTADGVSG